MARAGLLLKSPSDIDRRTINISLSPAGEARYAELNQALNEHSGRVMRWIPDDDQQTVHVALRLLSEALKAEAASVPTAEKQEGICDDGIELSCCEPC
jgi:DNA-binding MarR family transcriptional regulator